MNAAESAFYEELEIFRAECESAARFLYIYFGIHEAARRNRRVLRWINWKPMFWNTVVWALPLSGDRKPFPLVQTPRDERDGQVSPDGRWLACVSREGGRSEVHVRPFTTQPPAQGSPSDAQWVFATGAENPRWLAGGRLSFVTSAGELTEERVTVVDVVDGPVFQWGRLRQLSVIPSASPAIDLTGDGKRLLVAMGTQSTAMPPPLNIVMHWLDGHDARDLGLRR